MPQPHSRIGRICRTVSLVAVPIDTIPMAMLQKKATDMRDGLHRAIARMPSHAEFIEKNCKAS